MPTITEQTQINVSIAQIVILQNYLKSCYVVWTGISAGSQFVPIAVSNELNTIISKNLRPIWKSNFYSISNWEQAGNYLNTNYGVSYVDSYIAPIYQAMPVKIVNPEYAPTGYIAPVSLNVALLTKWNPLYISWQSQLSTTLTLSGVSASQMQTTINTFNQWYRNKLLPLLNKASAVDYATISFSAPKADKCNCKNTKQKFSKDCRCK
jgi:hypothetical protein